MEFIERRQLHGRGCGLVDLTLLASVLATPGVKLRTLDKPLAALAEDPDQPRQEFDRSLKHPRNSKRGQFEYADPIFEYHQKYVA